MQMYSVSVCTAFNGEGLGRPNFNTVCHTSDRGNISEITKNQSNLMPPMEKKSSSSLELYKFRALVKSAAQYKSLKNASCILYSFHR